MVIGAGAAGMAAATRARRVDPEAEITVLEASQEFARGTCSLPYYISGEVAHRESLFATTRSDLSKSGITLVLSARVEAVEATRRRVLFGHGGAMSYDRLVVTTGSQAKPFPIAAGQTLHPRLWRLRSVADAEEIRRQLFELKPRTVAIIGGGYLGLEMAEVLTLRGCKVTIFHRQSTLMRLLPPCHERLMSELSRQGVNIVTGCEVQLADPDCRQHTVQYRTDDGQSHSEGFDALFLANGVEPAPHLLAQAGARLGKHGGVLVNEQGETTLSGVYAAGDGVELPSYRGSNTRFVPLATTAARLGRVCGENAVGGSLRMPATHACLAIRLFSQQVAAAGHPDDWTNAESHTVEFGLEGATFPRRKKGCATLLTEPGTGRLVGAQIVAPEATGLADLASIAIGQESTLRELAELDACYTPPLSGLWHPFYLAWRQSEKRSRGVYR